MSAVIAAAVITAERFPLANDIWVFVKWAVVTDEDDDVVRLEDDAVTTGGRWLEADVTVDIVDTCFGEYDNINGLSVVRTSTLGVLLNTASLLDKTVGCDVVDNVCCCCCLCPNHPAMKPAPNNMAAVVVIISSRTTS
jgi:hypothetical protein